MRDKYYFVHGTIKQCAGVMLDYEINPGSADKMLYFHDGSIASERNCRSIEPMKWWRSLWSRQ